MYDIWRDECNKCRENVCCSKESFAIARRICKRIGAEHHIVDVSKEFKKEVIDYFIRELKANRTPSPCVFCNPKVKFRELFKFAEKVGAEFVATGHYARVEPSPKSEGSTLLLKAKDEEKDQTYSLSFLTQKDLARIIFPLGDLTKDQVYEIAKKQKGFEIFEKRKQSQDFCFISKGSIPRFLEKEIGINEGLIMNTSRKVVGTHRGLHFYTIGQRRGIGIAGLRLQDKKAETRPYYVAAKDEDTNTLFVSRNRSQFAKSEIMLKPYNLISEESIKKPIKVTAKLRSTAMLKGANLSRCGDSLSLKFSQKQQFVTPGQVAVFYDGQVCLGGGCICDA